MKTKNKYYKGILLCQFQTTNTKKVGNSTVYTSQSQIALEPRYRYDEAEEITEEEYIKGTSQSAIPFIKQPKPGDVEFSFLNAAGSEQQSLIKRVDEIVLVLNEVGNSKGDINSYSPTTPINNFISPEPDKQKTVYYDAKEIKDAHQLFNFNPNQKDIFYSPFEAVYGKASHGKLKGLAYCKEVQLLDQPSGS